MTNLILSGCRRLLHNRAFHITSLVVAVSGLFEITMMIQDDMAFYDTGVFAYATLGILAVAEIVPLFTGCEFSDGTIRNKLIAGHKRSHVYVAMLVTSLFAEFLLIVIWSVAYLVPGMIYMSHANAISVYVILYLTMFLELAVFTSIFTLITFTIGNRSSAAVVSIFVSLLLLIQGAAFSSMLKEPEFYGPELVLSEEGEMTVNKDHQPNPNYIAPGTLKRAFYELLMDFTPGGQAIQISEQNISSCKMMCIYDIGWLCTINTIGILIFHYKDLK